MNSNYDLGSKGFRVQVRELGMPRLTSKQTADSTRRQDPTPPEEDVNKKPKPRPPGLQPFPPARVGGAQLAPGTGYPPPGGKQSGVRRS